MPSLFKQRHVARGHESEPPGSSSASSAAGSRKSRKSGSGKKAAAAAAAAAAASSNRTSLARAEARREFLRTTTKSTQDEIYTNPESLPSVEMAYNIFQRIYPKFSDTWAVDDLRDREYYHLEENQRVCMDYCGFGLFSYDQQVLDRASASFGLAYISANLPTHAMYGAPDEGTTEFYIRKRVMEYLNINEGEYSMVFTASRGSAFKLLAESYPFHLNPKLLTVYDFESEAVSWMAESAKQKGAKILSACFKWPSLRIGTSHLKKLLQEKKSRSGDSAKGLFVFPVQSRMTGAKYSYQWMSQAQQNKWHVLLDASALGPKDMDSLGLSLFRPDFIVSSFYKVFGTDPTGFGCLFIKNTVIHSLHNSSRARAVGMVRIVSLGAADREDADPVRDYSDDEDGEDFQRGAAVWGLEPGGAGGGKVYPTSSFSGPYLSTGKSADFGAEDGLRASSSQGGSWKPWKRDGSLGSGKSNHSVDFSGQLTRGMDAVGEIDEGGPSEDEYEPLPASDVLLRSGDATRSGEMDDDSPIRWSAEARSAELRIAELPAGLNGQEEEFDEDEEGIGRIGDSQWRFGGTGEIEEQDDVDEDDEDYDDVAEGDDGPVEFQTLAGQGISPIMEEEELEEEEDDDDEPPRDASSHRRPGEEDDFGRGTSAAGALSEIEEESDEGGRKTTTAMEYSSDEEIAQVAPEMAESAEHIFPVDDEDAVGRQPPGANMCGDAAGAEALGADEGGRTETLWLPMRSGGGAHFATSDELPGANHSERSCLARDSPRAPGEFRERAAEEYEAGADEHGKEFAAASLDRRKGDYEEEEEMRVQSRHSAKDYPSDEDEQTMMTSQSGHGNGGFAKGGDGAAGKSESPEVEMQRAKARSLLDGRGGNFKRFTAKELSEFQELGVQGLVHRFQSLNSSSDPHGDPESPTGEANSSSPLPGDGGDADPKSGGTSLSSPRSAAEDAGKGPDDTQFRQSGAGLGGAAVMHSTGGNSVPNHGGYREGGAANNGLHGSEMSTRGLSPDGTPRENAENGYSHRESERGSGFLKHGAAFVESGPEERSGSELREGRGPEAVDAPSAEDDHPVASNMGKSSSPRKEAAAIAAAPKMGRDSDEEWRGGPTNAPLFDPEKKEGGGFLQRAAMAGGSGGSASEWKKPTTPPRTGSGAGIADQKDDYYDASEMEKSPRHSRTSSAYFSPTGSRHGEVDMPRSRSSSFDTFLNTRDEDLSGAEGARAGGDYSSSPTSPRSAMMLAERERQAGGSSDLENAAAIGARRNAVHPVQDGSSLRTNGPGEDTYITIMPRKKRGTGRLFSDAKASDGRTAGSAEVSGLEEECSSSGSGERGTERRRRAVMVQEEDEPRFRDLGADRSWEEERSFRPSRPSPDAEVDGYLPSVSTPPRGHMAAGRHRRRESVDFRDAQDGRSDLRSNITLSRDVDLDDEMLSGRRSDLRSNIMLSRDMALDHEMLSGRPSDLRNNITLSRDVDFDDEMLSGRPSDASDMLLSGRQSLTLSRDLALFDMQESDEESFPSQYFSGSLRESNASRYIGDEAPSTGYWEDDEGDTDDDFQDYPDVELWEGQREPLVSCKGLDFADSLGLTKLNYRLRYLINWLVNSLLKLRHPGPNQGIPLIRIYGPKVKYDRGAAVAFNMFDWKGGLIQPGLVQKLADRSNISLGAGKLCNIVDPEQLPDFLVERERMLGLDGSDDGVNSFHHSGKIDSGRNPLKIPVVTAAMGFVTSFEDVYRLWSFLAKFLDADFVSKEVWKYHSLNQETIVM